MKTYKKITCSQVDQVTCDRCGRADEADDFEGQEFLSHEMCGGYGSVFGDGHFIKLDLCQHCVRDVLGQWLRVYWEDGTLIPTPQPIVPRPASQPT